MEPKTPMKSNWLQFKNVEIRIGEESIIKDLSLELALNEHCAVIGPNGSGKSTLINTIGRLFYPVVKNGSYLKIFDNELINIWDMKKNVAFVKSDIDLRISRSQKVKDVIISGFYGTIGINKNTIPLDTYESKASKILDELNLAQISHKKYSEVSDGQKRKVLIARAITNDPKVLVLDEPTAMLDLKSSYDIIRLLRNLANTNTTLLYTTNTLDNIIPETQRVIFIKQGVIISSGTPDKMLTSESLSKLFDTKIKVYRHNNYWRSTPNY